MAQQHVAPYLPAGHPTSGYHSNLGKQVRQKAQYAKVKQGYHQIKKILAQPPIEWTMEDIARQSIPQEEVDEILGRPAAFIDFHPWSLTPPTDRALCTKVDSITEYNREWPWNMEAEKLVTRAPYATLKSRVDEVRPDGVSRPVYHTNFKNPKVEQATALFRSVPAMELVYPILFRHHSTFSSLAATCQDGFECVGFFAEHWDITGRDLLGADDENSQISPSNYVIVSPFRTPGHPFLSNKHQLKALQNLTKSVVNHGSHLHILHLHRIPMLTMEVLNLIVPQMTSLRVLGIYRCPLIHVGHLNPLLDILQIVRPNSTHRPRPELDFSPRWHRGPPGGQSYGVTWDDFGYNSCLAIWQIVTQALPQAISQGVDLISIDSAFRQWLEMGLLADVSKTIDAILFEKDPWKLAAQLDFGNTGGQRHKVKALAGTYYTCDACSVSQLGIFYSDWDIKTCEEWHGSPLFCLGCKLIVYLDGEEDHDKKLQTAIVREKWLKLARSNAHHAELDEDGVPQLYITENIHMAITQPQILQGLDTANKLDKKRRYVLPQQHQASNKGKRRAAPVIGEVAHAGRPSFW